MPEITYRDASKIRVLEAPRLAPGVCTVCGCSDNEDRQYVDTGWDIEFYGVVYFCTFCFLEVANHVGCLTKEQSEALEDELNRAKQTILNFRNKEKIVDDALNQLRTSGLLDLAVTGMLDDNDSSNNKTKQDSLFDSTDGDSGSTKANSNTEQSDSKQGSNDVPAATGDEFDDFL